MKITKLKSMFALLAMLCLGGIAGCSGGCTMFQGAAIATNADPVVVHAQRLQKEAQATFHEFVTWEDKNHTLLGDPPALKAVANNIRANYKQWDDDLTASIHAYQAIRSKENANKLDMTLAVISEALAAANRHFNTQGVAVTVPKP